VPTYTVHEPQPVADDIDERATRLVFIKEGFSILAFAIPVLWLLVNRLWLVLILFVVVTAAVIGGVSYASGNTAMAGWVSFALNLIFGFEARNIHRGVLARKGYDVIGVVTGRDLEDAERRFLTEWLPQAGGKPAANAAPRSGGGSVPAVGMGMATG